MSSEASAVTTPTEAASVTEAKPSDQMTPEQSAKFWETGELPIQREAAPAKKDPPKKQEAAPAPKSETEPEADPGTETQKPHLRTKEENERRFRELSEDRGRLQRENEELKRKLAAPSDRKTEPAPQPAPAELQAPAPLKQFLEKFFADAPNKGKSYEEGVEAWQDARDKFKDQQNEKKLNQAIESDRQRQRSEASAQKLQKDFEGLQQRYPDVKPETLEEIGGVFMDKDIPLGIKQIIGGSDIFADLVYVLGQDRAELGKLVELCKTNPTQALRKIINTESLVRDQLKSNAKPSSETPAEAKPAKTEAPVEQPKPRTPKPPAEVGGRGAVSGDAQVEAARSGNFAAFEAEQRRKYASR